MEEDYHNPSSRGTGRRRDRRRSHHAVDIVMMMARPMARSRLIALAVCLATVSTPAAATAAAASPPTPRQIARAVRRAASSSALWATINICNSKRHPDLIGVRGEMPALGFTATMTMTVQLDSWSPATRRFTAIRSPNAVSHVAAGAHASGLQQGGAEFPFAAGTRGLWQATVTFAWIRGGRLLGRATRTTTSRHPDADFGSPAHYSAASCRIA
jgi:hypothetical protein